MTRSEREQQILRYLRGDMTSVEEQNFFIQVALDRELRDELMAQRAIEGSIRGFRDVERTQQHTVLRSRTAALLAGYPASQVGATVAGGAMQPSTIAGQGSGLSTRWVLAAMLAVGLSVVLFFALPNQEKPGHSTGNPTVQQTLQQAPVERHSRPAQLPGATPNGRPGPATGADLQTPSLVARPATREREIQSASRPARSAEVHRRPEANANIGERSAVQRHDVPEPTSPRKQNDSLRVGVDVQIDVQK
jgi:hypothetical protein